MPYEKTKKELPDGFIDLGEKMKGMEIMPIIEPAEEAPEVHYPSLYFLDAKGLDELPKEGMATIYFKKVMERKETITENGKTKKRHSIELCIYGIKSEDEESEESEEYDDEDEIENGLMEAEED